jgi:hypothetical protein
MAMVSPVRQRQILALRAWGLLVLMLSSVGLVLSYLDQLQPIRHWMVWRYAMVSSYALLFGLASFSIGHTVVGWMLKKAPLPLGERLLCDAVVGVLLFALSVFMVGIFGGIRGVFFWALPLSLFWIGIPRLAVDLPTIVSQFRTNRELESQPPSLLHSLAIGFGAIGVVLIYLPILNPQVMSYDAHVYHVGIAEHYVGAGGIQAFHDGWFPGTIPHLASWLYTWAFALPHSDLHARAELAVHIEFLIFLLTLAGVPLMVERLLYGRRVRAAWAGYFLFPGIFLYDSSLSMAADHVLALWAIPLVLVAMRCTSMWTRGTSVLLGTVLAGAFLSKIQAVYMLVPVGLFVLYRAVSAVVRGRQAAKRLAYLLFVPTFGSWLALTAPYWLANVIWYGNPVYPMLAGSFPSHPWRPGFPGYETQDQWIPHGTLWRRVTETLLAPFDFSFKAHDWESFHHDLPVFGFLFTLSLPILFFYRGSKRIAWLAAAAMLGVLIWYWTYHQDRYLQSILPWMVAVTVATFALAWQSGWQLRTGIAALVGLQLVWGGDVPFLPTHALIGDTPYATSIHLLSSTFRKDWEHRFDMKTGFEAANALLPKDSAVLLHQGAFRVGIGRPTYVDNPKAHGALDYGTLGEDAKVYGQLRSYGVTHVLAEPERCGPSELRLASELVFHHFLLTWVRKHQRAGDWNVWTMPDTPPPSRPFGSVVYLGCGKRGQFTLAEVDSAYETDQRHPAVAGDQLPEVTGTLLGDADVVALDQRCPVGVPGTAGARWERATQWRNVAILVKMRN